LLETKCIWDVGGTLWFCPGSELGAYCNNTGNQTVCQTGFGEGRGGEKSGGFSSSEPAVPESPLTAWSQGLVTHTLSFNQSDKWGWGRGGSRVCLGFQELGVS